MQTVLKSDQSISGRPAPFYRYTNPPYVVAVAYARARLEMSVCSLAGLQRVFSQDTTVPGRNFLSKWSSSFPVTPEPAPLKSKTKKQIVANIPNLFPIHSHSQGGSQGASLKGLYTN